MYSKRFSIMILCGIFFLVGLFIYNIRNNIFFTPPTKTTYDNSTHVHDVSWTVNDIQKIRPKWTKEKCVDFLDSYYDHILKRIKIEGDIIIRNLIMMEELVLSEACLEYHNNAQFKSKDQ